MDGGPKALQGRPLRDFPDDVDRALHTSQQPPGRHGARSVRGRRHDSDRCGPPRSPGGALRTESRVHPPRRAPHRQRGARGMTLHEWALQWRIPFEALADLKLRMGLDTDPDPAAAGRSEAWAQSQVRLKASRLGMRLWRNNVGALLDERGVPVRFGLANDSKEMNKRIKSADLIGIKPVLIGPQHVGSTIGQFLSREVKAPGWRYTGTSRERAQLAWVNLVASMGGDAAFSTGAL